MRAVLILALLAVGCTKHVSPCPEPPVVFPVTDPVDYLATDARPADIAKAYATSRLLWRAEAYRRGDLLDAYRKRPK